MAVSRYVGARVKRIEDPKLIRGQGQFVDDLTMPGMLHAAFVRSPHAHARIVRIDLGTARALPGVVAALAAADLPELLKPLPVQTVGDMLVAAHQLLAAAEIHYEGQPVAVVVADDPYVARDAAERVAVEYAPLPAVIDLDRAAAGAPFVHESFGTNVALRQVLDAGDVDAAFGQAPVVVRQRMINQRLAPVPLEPRGTVAMYDGSMGQGILTVWTSTQEAHAIRDSIGQTLGLETRRIRVITPDVGGGFGAKLNTYPEDIVVAQLARRLGRAVKWIETRRENMLTTTHGRAQVADLEAAAERDGRLRGLRMRLLADLGGELASLTAIIPTLTPLMIQGPYKIPAIHSELLALYTNTCPTAAYRGAGRPEATYYLERVMDLVAREAGLDPAEVRRRNFIPPSEFPYKTLTGATYDSGEYAKPLDEALRLSDYRALRQRQAASRREGRLVGVGVASYVEICGFGPWELGTVRMNPDATVTVITGTSPHGQGDATGFAQIAADALGVSPQDVTVVHGDTLMVQFGGGTSGSRSMSLGGSAVHLASLEVREQILGIAANMLEAATSDLVLENRGVTVRGAPGRTVALADIAKAAYAAKHLPDRQSPGLEATSRFKSQGTTFPFGTHVCVVDVDPDTGGVRLERYVCVDDCGRVINPLLVDGQIHGGIAQGAAQALLEWAVYDENGQMLTAALSEYAVPKAHDVPRVERGASVTPTPRNPLGAKGIGEAATIGSTPCVVNAVVDALAHLGVRHLDMPLSPERVHAAIAAAGGPAPDGTGSPAADGAGRHTDRRRQ
ncbi:MAG TPA: xanthine dehydrogenase family protein molybdopterin-binding subunit [bacterium]|nr:xanthine dehydrogenase family protein molybdopterin-binding subunit [bacterium]